MMSKEFKSHFVFMYHILFIDLFGDQKVYNSFVCKVLKLFKWGTGHYGVGQYGNFS